MSLYISFINLGDGREEELDNLINHIILISGEKSKDALV